MAVELVNRKRGAPAITVLITDYNTPPENLSHAVRSILAQSFQNFELLIVDDGSDRPTRSVLEEISDDRLRLIKHEMNEGTAAALNTGMRAATGEYVVRIDSDDRVKPTYIETLYQAILEEPEFAVISCRAQEFRSDGSFGTIVGRVGEKRAENIIRGDTPVHGASLMRRSDILDVGGYPNYRRGQDFALWSELVLSGKRLKVIEPILYHYRVDVSDYKKRKLWKRRHSIYASIRYYPKLQASPLDYRYIAKSVVAGLLPSRVLKFLSEKRRSDW